MTATFLPVTLDGIGKALEMGAMLFHHEGLPYDAARARRGLEGLVANPDFGGAWFIQAGDASVGYLVMTICYSLEFDGRFGLLDEFFLDEGWRGLGLGGQSLRFAEETCRALGMKVLRLEVTHTNVRAKGLYRNAGFRAEERDLMTKWL